MMQWSGSPQTRPKALASTQEEVPCSCATTLPHQVSAHRCHRRPRPLRRARSAEGQYKVWVRGYGLVDSPKMDAEPGKSLNLRAVPAPSETAAAQYYPAICWYSMLKIPDESQFGGKSSIPPNITQSDWLTVVKNRSCVGCISSASSRPERFPPRS